MRIPRIFRALFAGLRPQDTRLFEEARFRVQMHRLLSLLGAVLVVGFTPLYALTNPEATDPLWARFGVAGLFIGLFAASYAFEWVCKAYVSCMRAVLYVTMGWFTALAVLNRFSVDYAVGLLLVYVVLATVVGFGARSVGPVIWFVGYGFLLAAAGALGGPPAGASPSVLLGCMGTVALVEAVLTRGWLQIRETIREQEQENERLDRFASVLSHDLRNPLNVAQGRLQLAKEEGGKDPEGHLSSAEEALGRMDDIIQDMLLLTWSEQEIGPEEVKTAELEEEAYGAWENVEAPQATFEVAAPARLKCHEGRLRRLLENLFRNAIEHGGEAVTITTGPLPKGSSSEEDPSKTPPPEEESEEGFFVEDDGPGIPEAKREKVLEGGYSSREEGTGLGLSIVQGIAEAHGWSMSVTEGREGGARFEFRNVEMDGQ